MKITHDYGIRTKQEVGQMVGLSRGRILQIENKFLDRLRELVLADPELRQMAIDMGLKVPAQESA
ncbi:MAG: sigma factor-like helix-turn-helix DNA-binding protein [Tepidisphaeraceae bacterium]